MDTKLTKKRLSSLWTYDWLKIVGVALALIFFWYLVLTTTATRITPAQEFTVFNYACNNSLSDKFHTHYNNAIDNGVFSYEVIETNYFDLAMSQEYASTLLEAHTSVATGDILFVPAIDNPDMQYTDENGNDAYLTCAETYLLSYGSCTYVLHNESDNAKKRGYFESMKLYLNEYYHGDYVSGELDEEKTDADFTARVTKNKDKRFKTAEQIAQGKVDERKRLEKYRNALIAFERYIELGVVEIISLSSDMRTENQYVFEGAYAINLCPTKNDEKRYAFDYDKYAENLTKYLSYETTKPADEGEESKTVTTSENMCAMFFRFDKVEESFQYESLLYLNALLETCLQDCLS